MDSDINRALGADGGGVAKETLGGAEYTFCPLNQGQKAEFVAWVKKKVMAGAAEGRGWLEPGAYRDLLAAASADIASGTYEWGQAGWGKFVQSDDGIRLLCLLALRRHHPNLIMQDVNLLIEQSEPEQIGRALREVLRDPKARGPKPNGPE